MKNLKNLQCLLMLSFLFVTSLQAQQDVSVGKKDFKSGKSGFTQAWKFIKDGDSFYNQQGVWYKSAMQEYIQAYAYNSDNPELNYKMGVCCLYSDNKEEAINYFLKALKGNENVSDDIYLLTGRAYQFSGSYLDAMGKYTEYLNQISNRDEEIINIVNKFIDECKSANIITRDTLLIEIINPGNSINSDADDYSPVLGSDGTEMFYTSRKQYFANPRDYEDTKYDENIFISRLVDSIWRSGVSVGKDVNTKYSEAPLYIDPAGERLYLYTGYDGDGDIKVSVSKKGKWKTPEAEGFGISGPDSETSFTIAPSGTELFFVSERKKNSQGGKDIFVMKKLSDRKWSKPLNLGPQINTAQDEEAVKVSLSGNTLYFSSRGHNTIGGFDIFISNRDSAGNWSNPQNAGYPLNSVWDDIYFTPSPVEDSTFYFATNRSGGLGGLDIYEGHYLPTPKPPVPEVTAPIAAIPEKRDSILVIRDTVLIVREVVPVPAPLIETGISLSGRVMDSETGASLVAKLEIIDLQTDQVITTAVSSQIDGTFRISLPAKKSYMVDVRSEGYLSEMKRLNISPGYTGSNYNYDIPLNKIQVGKTIVLNNILFETGKAVVTTGSYPELDRLVSIMNENKSMKIQISGHTDKTGSEVLNAKLSTDRAAAVVSYISSKGVDNTRMTHKGFGSSQPISDNATAEGRAKNRRVEFKILEF